LTVANETVPVTGTAWLDHEWSSEYLAEQARGWDWTGINFDDGAALMAFVIRGNDGRDYWAGGALRDAAGMQRVLAPGEVRIVPLRQWRSPRTNVTYPVSVRVEAGAVAVELEPLMDDQELDSRGTVGTIYWEGAVRARVEGRVVGRGYLELVGYSGALRI
jgi:predicted secreted hydrolase